MQYQISCLYAPISKYLEEMRDQNACRTTYDLFCVHDRCSQFIWPEILLSILVVSLSSTLDKIFFILIGVSIQAQF